MKAKLSIYSHPNHLTFRTAIEREQKQFIKIAFAVHLSAVISAERYRSDSGALKSAVLHFVFFMIIINKMQQSAKRKLLLNKIILPEVFPLTARIDGSGKTMAFENRYVGCKEREKINRRRTLCTLRINFFEATPQTACIFSKEYYRYDANGNITAEKDGPFTDEEEFVFTYSYFEEQDVYGADYGFGLDAPKETEQSNPQDLFAYRRNYTWNERNLLTKSSDRNFTVHYRYGNDGQRALKYTDEGRSETLYFNNFFTIHIPTQDQNNPQGLRVHKHIFVGNSRLVTAMTHTENQGDNEEQKVKRYYYHTDHLQSAQFITNAKGEQYEHIEYTPYGELWIEETAPGIDKLPFRFTGKELDEETGLYYYGARYLDPKYSRWLSGDPALNDYIPKAPIDDDAKKHNENLPGMGGVFNTVNLHLYHYAGNNPVKYVDPDGEFMLLVGGIGPYGGGTGGSETLGIYFMTSSDGKSARIGLYSMSEIGSFFGGGLGGGVNITIAPFATKFSDIEGSGMTLGGSLSTSIVFALFKKVCPPSLSKTSTGLEFGFNPYAKDLSAKIKSFNISVSFVGGPKWSTPGEGHLFYSFTKELTGKDVDKVIQTIEEYWSSGKYNELIEYLKSFVMPKNKNMEAE